MLVTFLAFVWLALGPRTAIRFSDGVVVALLMLAAQLPDAPEWNNRKAELMSLASGLIIVPGSLASCKHSVGVAMAGFVAYFTVSAVITACGLHIGNVVVLSASAHLAKLMWNTDRELFAIAGVVAHLAIVVHLGFASADVADWLASGLTFTFCAHCVLICTHAKPRAGTGRNRLHGSGLF